MRLVRRAIGRGAEVEVLIEAFERELAAMRSSSGRKVRAYFEEWADPVITGIAWVGELIELRGGIHLFADRRGCAARERITTDEEIRSRRPQVVIASWCGKPVDQPALRERFGSTLAALIPRSASRRKTGTCRPNIRLGVESRRQRSAEKSPLIKGL
jgi:iron complex transport system substrate-binding protein